MVFNKENWMFFPQCKTRPIFFIEFIEGIPRIMFHHIFLHFYHRIESNRIPRKILFRELLLLSPFQFKIKNSCENPKWVVWSRWEIFLKPQMHEVISRKIIIRMYMKCHGDVVRLKFTSSFIFFAIDERWNQRKIIH